MVEDVRPDVVLTELTRDLLGGHRTGILGRAQPVGTNDFRVVGDVDRLRVQWLVVDVGLRFVVNVTVLVVEVEVPEE